MSHRPTKQQATRESRANGGGEDIHEFLVRELPPGKTEQAQYLTDALLKAGARYDRYAARRKEWLDYAARGGRLKKITNSINELEACLSELDFLSREELESRVDPKEIETLIGSLRFLSKETTHLGKEIQENGRPRDLAAERWIMEVADIYENAFSEPLRVWASDTGPVSRFYYLLKLSRPTSFARYSKLNLRQVDRVLKRIRRKSHSISVLLAALQPSDGAETK
jgi:hypothetical protein